MPVPHVLLPFEINKLQAGAQIEFERVGDLLIIKATLSSPAAVFIYTADGALVPSSGLHTLKNAFAGTFTLALPPADHLVLRIRYASAQNHVVNVSGGAGFSSLGPTTVGAVGDGVTLVSCDGSWHVESLRNVTPA